MSSAYRPKRNVQLPRPIGNLPEMLGSLSSSHPLSDYDSATYYKYCTLLSQVPTLVSILHSSRLTRYKGNGLFLPRIRALGFPAAIVAQNGLEYLDVPWDTFDVLFIGGNDAWKFSRAATELVQSAKEHGKKNKTSPLPSLSE